MLTSPMQGSVNAAEEWAERTQELRDEDGACEGLTCGEGLAVAHADSHSCGQL